MQPEKRHHHSRENGQQKDGDGNVATACSIRDGNSEPTINPVDEPTDETAPKEADKDVAGIMDTEVKTGVAISERPQDKGYAEQSPTHEQREIDGDAERVGGMGREEAIVAATIAVNHVHKVAYLWVVGRSPACHERFYNLVVNGAGKQCAESCCQED